MSTYLVITRGRELGVRYPLDKSIENNLGRGLECNVQLNDPLSSRVHAKIVFEESHWLLRDAGSRNGTLINGSKTDVATLSHGNLIRIGNTDLEFVDDTITEDLTVERINLSHDLRGEKIGSGADGLASGMSAFLALRKAGRSEDLSDLHELSIRCISLSSPDQVIDLAIEVLRKRTQATLVAFLLADHDGKLIIQRRYPASNDSRVSLSDRLTELVCKQAKAVWVKNESKEVGEGPLRHYADAICVPLLHENKTIGVVHLYREKEVFEKSSFDFTIAAASFLAVSLIRARSESSLRISRDRLQDK